LHDFQPDIRVVVKRLQQEKFGEPAKATDSQIGFSISSKA
jgi:hypothetical protein